jgi:hypothetical protein
MYSNAALYRQETESPHFMRINLIIVREMI